MSSFFKGGFKTRSLFKDTILVFPFAAPSPVIKVIRICFGRRADFEEGLIILLLQRWQQKEELYALERCDSEF